MKTFYAKKVLILSLLAIFSVNPVSAAIPTNQATSSIDWGTLALNFIFGTGSTTDQFTDTFVTLEDESGLVDFDDAFSFDWTSLTQSSINYSDSDYTTAISDAIGSTTELTSMSELESSVPSIITANADRQATITTSGDGILLITASYDLSADVTDSLLYEAYASLGFFVSIDAVGSTNEFDAFADVFTGVGGGPSSSQDSGTIALAVPFEDGDVLDFYAYTYSEVISNPVPLPASVWLFGSGLLMLMMRRSL